MSSRKKTRATDTSTSAPDIEYLVRMPQPWTHYFEVMLTISGPLGNETDLVMPVWTPGSYLIREFARNVEGFSAADGSGASLTWSKISKNRWRVQSKQASKLRVTYQVYAFERSVRTSFLDDLHGTINGASLFMYVEGNLDCNYVLQIEPFPGWDQITTGLEPLKGAKGKFRATDFDTLIDCPIEIGRQQVLEFSVRKIPHRISICGQGNHNPGGLRADLQKIVECASAITGDIPYRTYTFLIHLVSEGGGGLEHANSTLLQVNRWTFKPEESYQRFLGLAAHEYFHVWNIKRLRPAGLGPFDYSQENYTRQLWVAEGLTDYYAEQILRRAKLLTPEAYLDGLAKNIKDLQEIPGRLVESVAEASFDTWIKFYRQDPNYPNKSVSYYLKGGLIGLILDLEIRNRAEGKSLDDVLRLLYTECDQKLGRGFTEDEFQAACENVAGAPLNEFFEDYCYGTRELDFSRYLNYAGLKFKEPPDADKIPAKSYLGISAKTADGKVQIVGVTRGSPAFEQGLNLNDELIALNGFRVNQDLLTARMTEAPPGTKLDLLIARDGRLLSLPVVLGVYDARDYKIERVPEPSARQKRVYEEWLCAKWDETRQEEKKPQP